MSTPEELEDKLDTAVQALFNIKGWAQAYPVEVFEPLTDEELKTALAALKGCGVQAACDRLHGSWARHILDGVAKLAEGGLPSDKQEN
jgi:hypothetical protein